jgi:hypothetical protein
MRNICPEVLRLQEDGTRLHLNEVLINLSLSAEDPLTTAVAHATRCGSAAGGFLQLKADMEKQAEVLTAQMAAPKMVRILTHALPSFKLRAFDASTGRYVALNEDAEWDEDGEVIEEEVPDDESEISDLSWEDE